MKPGNYRYYLELGFLLAGTSFNEKYTKEIHERIEKILKGIPLSVISDNALSAMVKGMNIYKEILKLENVDEMENAHVTVKITRVHEISDQEQRSEMATD
jgi:RecB family exonuclease